MAKPNISKQLETEKLRNKLNLKYINCLESYIIDDNSEFKNFSVKEKLKFFQKIKTDLKFHEDYDNIEEFLDFVDCTIINQNEIFFGSSKSIIPKNFEVDKIKSNYITFHNNNINVTLFEYKELFNIEQTLNKHYSEYLKKHERNIIKDNFYLEDNLIKRTIVIENNDFFINYWFIKNNKAYKYQIHFDEGIDSLIKDNIKKNNMQKIKTSNEFNIHLKEYGECVDADNILNIIISNYLDANNEFNIAKNNFILENSTIEKTFLVDGNILFINYWFIKDNNAYRYQIHYNIFQYDDLIINLIDSTSPGIINLAKFFTKNFLSNSKNKTISKNDSFNIMNSFKKEISIIIHTNNISKNLDKCIESIYRNTRVNFDLYLINNSKNNNGMDIITKYKKYGNIHLIKNNKKTELLEKVVHCVKSTKNDIIILNSDCIVTPKWDQKLLFAAYSDEKIATVSPLTNIDIPSQNINDITTSSKINKISKFIENISIYGNIESPIFREFCLFIKRDAINELNYLIGDSSYENDWINFNIKINEKGWKNVINDSIFIFNKRNDIISLDETILNKNIQNLTNSKKHVNILEKWKKFTKSKKIKNLLSFIKYELNYKDSIIKKNLLYVTDLKNNRPLIDDITHLIKEYNIFCLTLEKKNIKLWYYTQDKFIFIKEMPFIVNIPNLSELNLFYVNLFKDYKIDLLFIRFTKTFGMKYCQDITPIMFASIIKTPIIYGRSTKYLIEQVNKLPNTIENNIKFKNEKGVVYTAIFGDYESLLDPKIINPNLDYICFTDNPNLKSNVWKICLIDFPELDSTRKARRIKTLPHKFLSEYEFSIWVDAAFLIVGDLEEYVNTFSKNNLFLGINHSWRDCIYEESKAILGLNKDNEEIVKKQIDKYKSEGFPENFGLIESGILFRRHNHPIISKLMDEWHDEIMNFSKRDQLSLNYVCWKNNFSYDEVPIFYWKNQFFDHYHHTKLANQNKVTIPLFRILLLDNGNIKNTKKSLDDINNINNNIPVTIFSQTDYSFLKDYNIKPCQLDANEMLSESINFELRNITEDFIIIINSGDTLQYSIIESLLEQYDKNNVDKLGCIIFDAIKCDNDETKFYFKSKFSYSPDSKEVYVKNNTIINREILLSMGGFEKDNAFINKYLSKIHLNYDVLQLKAFEMKFFRT